MSVKLKIIHLLLFLFVSYSSAAQPYYFKHYRVEDGLGNNTVFSLLQDRRGFMWFGSKEGLSRFDGYTFKNFRDKRFPEPIRGFILQIINAENGALWIGTRKGVFKFDERTETFTAVKAVPETEIEHIETDTAGRLWVLTSSKLYRYDGGNKSMIRYLKDEHSPVASFTCHGNEIWACTDYGSVYSYNSSKNLFLPQNQGIKSLENEVSRVIKIYRSDNVLFIGATTGLLAFDVHSKVTIPVIYPAPSSEPVFVRDIARYTDNEIWVATESGLYIYDLKLKTITNVRQNYTDPYALSDNAIYALQKDSEGGIWLATYFGGVNYYHPQRSIFKKYFANSSVNRISGNAVREIRKDANGNLWVGTEDAGLNRISAATGAVTSFRAGAGDSGISSNNIHGLLCMGKELWVGTFERGLDVLDINTGKALRHYKAKDRRSGLKSDFIISIFKTRKGQIFVGTNNGVYIYEQDKDTFKLVGGLPSYLYVSTIIEDDNEILWIGTIGEGVFSYNPRLKTYTNYRHNPKLPNSLSSDMVCGVYQDSNRDYWFATENGGLTHMSNNAKTFTRLTTDDGLPSNLVLETLEDKQKNLWITTSKGLVRLNLFSKQMSLFTRAQGLLTDQFNYNSAFSDGNTLYFGTVAGLISFKPEEISTGTVVPPIYLTSFQIDNHELEIDKTILKKTITSTDSIELRHDQSTFNLGFAALSFISPQVLRYAYKLEGVDHNWNYLNSNRRVYYTELSPGTYTFRVRSVDATGKKGAEKVLVINIHQPYWLSGWAWILYALLAAALIYWGFTSYHHRIKSKSRKKLEQLELAKEKEVYHAKIEFFTNVAHEIRTPLTLIKGPLENVMDDVGDNKTVQKNLKSIERNTDRLLALTNQLLHFRATETNGLNLSYVQMDISKFVKKITGTYQVMSREKELEFKTQVHEPRLSAFIDLEAFTKIMDNLISNAIKYAEKMVIVELCAVIIGPNTFTISICNDGFLIPDTLRDKVFESFYRIPDSAHKPGSGIGLSLARSLAELHGGSLVLAAYNGKTNVFLLTLPIHQDVEFKLSNLTKVL
ncbi:two-component regulator propeller domain-containing protein [Pedobacter lithocola]|uniref:histidine kinase n=1 Tax=Pedobacter lithocola TaxID=1908239 RepID=A0ABV8PED9_9SPHI